MRGWEERSGRTRYKCRRVREWADEGFTVCRKMMKLRGNHKSK